jgi:DNA polymerase III delta prime subunit
MTSFVITAKQKENRISYITEFCSKRNIQKVDITLIEKDMSAKTATQSIGIDDVKNMQKKIFLKPIKSKEKAVIIEDAQLLTTEAQNALLKVLEEPPANTLLFLGSESKEALLPTILSRCSIVALDQAAYVVTEEEKEKLNAFIKQLPILTTGDKLKIAETQAKNKEEGILWLEKLILTIRDSIISKYTLDTSDTLDKLTLLRSFQSLHTLLKTTNVNPRFGWENTLLSL